MSSPHGQLRGTRRMAFGALVLGAIGIGVAYASAFAPAPIARWGPWIMALALPVCLVAVMTFGAIRQGGGSGALAIPFAVVFVLVTGGFLLALLMPTDTPQAPLFLGLPYRAAVIVYGVGLLPLFVLPFAYAYTFDALTLSDADVERIRAVRAVNAPQGGH